MLFVWIALWFAAGLLLIANRRNAAGRWLSVVAFCGGMGALASQLEGWIAAGLASGAVDVSGEQALRALQRGCSWTSYYGMPFGYLCFGAAYNRDLLPAAAYRWLPFAAAVPPLAMLLLPPAADYPVRYELLAVWSLPYAALGTALLLAKRHVHPAERRAHALLLLAVMPAVLIALAMNYVLPLFGFYRLWVYNVWPIGFAFVIFLISLFNFGFLGVQLLIEKRQLDYSLRAITSGTAMLNHAIKNDIGKIKLFADKIAREAGERGELREDLGVVSAAAAHIEEMIRSVHERTQELRLQAQRVSLAELARGELAAVAEQAREREIAVHARLGDDAYAEADPEQTKEAIHNVLQNAIDAMPRGGELHVAVFGGKRGSTVEVRDTGAGIEKARLRKVTEPFYTTKSGGAMNFGLGLAYCAQLMSRQGGELRISSEPGKGTTVRFHFRALKRARTRGGRR
ncbi:HAMP domain-containing histidine kinase [Paenibacillus sp. MWE-103]|uniref:histidine kinase n=1 Tax=Paenibacillus artemisiicola TaxID=1172618 RepID=A0ABS3W8G9_9BACL|nr:HAMP domain-containing sensor histidine kinase [Paenibacillus artemisiicola]MBO7744615.1 HAMP domain-containing histidine kinase [Paenibacillus artemisiicola]